MSIRIAVPKPYQAVIARYQGQNYRGKRAASHARALFTFISATNTDYDGGQLTFDFPIGGLTFEYYISPGPPPVLPIVGIDIAGAVTAAQIGSITAVALGANANLSIQDNGPSTASFYVVQNQPGEAGNTEILSNGIVSGSLFINGFNVNVSSVFFFGGQSLGIPLLWGPQRAMGPTTPNTIQGFAGEGGGPAAPITFNSAASYSTLAKTGIANVPTSNIGGNMGVSPAAASTITGLALVLDGTGTFSTSAQVTGVIRAADYAVPTPADLTAVILEMQAAYVNAAGRVANFVEVGAGLIGGLSLVPGVYKWSTGVTIASNLTLVGGPGAVFIFEIAGNLTLAAAQSLILSGGVLRQNVIWQVAGNVSLGATSNFSGVILCLTDITLLSGATFAGRLFSQTAVNFQQNTVTGP